MGDVTWMGAGRSVSYPQGCVREHSKGNIFMSPYNRGFYNTYTHSRSCRKDSTYSAGHECICGKLDNDIT